VRLSIKGFTFRRLDGSGASLRSAPEQHHTAALIRDSADLRKAKNRLAGSRV
jgi:hypothetical protein